mmetsp:Transcript_62674/g.111733  ORF Transcript_62674/g.111733 Transcript_62674/m.111733 type:complete len:277 (+) Transcript_62674:2813-3643(+)
MEEQAEHVLQLPRGDLVTHSSCRARGRACRVCHDVCCLLLLQLLNAIAQAPPHRDVRVVEVPHPTGAEDVLRGQEAGVPQTAGEQQLIAELVLLRASHSPQEATLLPGPMQGHGQPRVEGEVGVEWGRRGGRSWGGRKARGCRHYDIVRERARAVEACALQPQRHCGACVSAGAWGGRWSHPGARLGVPAPARDSGQACSAGGLGGGTMVGIWRWCELAVVWGHALTLGNLLVGLVRLQLLFAGIETLLVGCHGECLLLDLPLKCLSRWALPIFPQ